MMPDRNGRLQCSSSKRITTRSLLSFLLLASVTEAIQLPLGKPTPQGSHTFTLKHIFHRGTYQYPDLHKRFDIPAGSQNAFAFEDDVQIETVPPQLQVKSENYEIQRLADRSWASVAKHLDYSSLTGVPVPLHESAWTMEDVPGPDTTDKDTVINLAYMAANAYVPKAYEGEWTNVSLGYNYSQPFGWEGDGIG